jgi:alkanesulfonate monooxygenase SsuD/methylene tetrahydromethanopterin reductase-like flavin-dependent oxidoreductase (luciferase family)
MTMKTWFGIHAATYGKTFNDVKQSCLEAEKQGLQLFTIIDHFMNEFHPWQGPHPLECWTTLAGLAAVTEKIRLGPLVSCYGYRHPAVLAKMATTIDHISNGRMVLGLGAGWHEAEFKGYMGRYPPNGERLRGLEESVEICKSMLSNEITNHDGKIYGNIKALNSPQPIQKHLPIMIGGGGEKVTLRIAAKYADITHFIAPAVNNLEILKSKLSALRRHCESVGRNYDEIRKGTWLIVAIDESMVGAEAKVKEATKFFDVPLNALDGYGLVASTPDTIADRVEEYIKMGFELITFVIVPQPTVEDIRLLAKDVIQAL